MRAIAYREPGPAMRADAFLPLDLPRPELGPRDLLVRVRAVSVNVVDTKLRRAAAPKGPRVLGFDAAGVVEAVGPETSLFALDDEIYYAGEIGRQGSNAELQAVDERLAGRKPASLGWTEAAALPLTSLTAWELLFDRMKLGLRAEEAAPAALLVIGGAGGVGSILIQLARALTDLTVIATASRPETAAWCREMGAHHVIDHRRPLAGEMERIGIPRAEYVASLTASETHREEVLKLVAPQGAVGIIDGPKSYDVAPFLQKAVAVCGEGMFVRSLHRTPDMIGQHHILNEVAALADAGRVRTTETERLGPLSVTALQAAHAALESGRTIGKITLGGL